jgi:hypothetical protein
MTETAALLAKHLQAVKRTSLVVDDRDLFMDRYVALNDHPDAGKVKILDAFSQGQLDSKLWLIDQIKELKLFLGRVWVVCGWIGTMSYLLTQHRAQLAIKSLRSFDVDPCCADLAETLNQNAVEKDWFFKATTLDAMDIVYDSFEYVTCKHGGMLKHMKETADTIINTSCEHMIDFDAWFEKIPSGKLVILQCSSDDTYDGHANNMVNLYELSSRAICKRVYFKGTLDCGNYLRHMLIGRK